MKRNPSLLRLVVLAMLVAVGVVISPILRVEGMCPTAHLINIVCAVLLGPVYSFVCACTIGVIRMSLMGVKVTRSALQNATSVASTLLTTESVVASIKEDTPAMPAGGAGGMGMM